MMSLLVRASAMTGRILWSVPGQFEGGLCCSVLHSSRMLANQSGGSTTLGWFSNSFGRGEGHGYTILMRGWKCRMQSNRSFDCRGGFVAVVAICPEECTPQRWLGVSRQMVGTGTTLRFVRPSARSGLRLVQMPACVDCVWFSVCVGTLCAPGQLRGGALTKDVGGCPSIHRSLCQRSQLICLVFWRSLLAVGAAMVAITIRNLFPGLRSQVC